MMSQIVKYLKSRTVWVALIAFTCNLLAALQVQHIAGLPVDQIATHKEVIASQTTVIAAGLCDLLAILFRIKAKAKFD
jgi:hypothetical protein